MFENNIITLPVDPEIQRLADQILQHAMNRRFIELRGHVLEENTPTVVMMEIEP